MILARSRISPLIEHASVELLGVHYDHSAPPVSDQHQRYHLRPRFLVGTCEFRLLEQISDRLPHHLAVDN